MAEDDDPRPLSDAKAIRAKLFARNWFHTSEALVRILKPDEAIMLCYLMNESERYKVDERTGGMKKWFYCRQRQVCKRIGFINQKQAILLKRLEDRGLIRRKIHGMPPKRYIRIMLKAIDRLMEEHGAYGATGE